ncbi:uncharacterized protein PV09_07055 [Verruconis gallopava]|uniref:Phospholipase/carboxylesterase/thioesterase domain-containing protein n=1 Tax=Verruconis gallopava TaxID=253628 RepID=A0A0D1YL98_9PEZI|nr:uncharacterized protein PV09_07055 [Verruconis gallopava]KIW01582.1 hypothetical protein PV09_07055 [Verruconis gallopava]
MVECNDLQGVLEGVAEPDVRLSTNLNCKGPAHFHVIGLRTSQYECPNVDGRSAPRTTSYGVANHSTGKVILREGYKERAVCACRDGRTMVRIVPTKDDNIPGKYAIVPPANGQPATNILVLLHGLGDTELPFKSFAEKLQLPETAYLALRGTSNLPFDLEGAHWGDDIVFGVDGTIEADTGFKKSTRIVGDDIIRSVLIDKWGYKSREILLFGYGQGGMLALNIAAELGLETELGGVVSIGGPLPSGAALPEVGKKCRTPVLLCHGYRRSAVQDVDVDRLKDYFEFVEVKEWRKTGDGMPASRDEMLPIMQFWARRLRSNRGVPDGSIEIT